MREHIDEDRGRPFDLPMGGLLSELLASEGVDAGGFEEDPGPPPIHASAPTAAGAEPPPTQSPHSEPDIALPGLLSDLLNLATAAETVAPPLAPDAPGPEQVKPKLALEPEAPCALEADPVRRSRIPEPPSFAIPGLLSLLSAEEDCSAGRGFASGPQVPVQAPDVLPEGEAPVFDAAEPALTVRDVVKNGPPLDELEIDDLSEPAAFSLPDAAPEADAVLLDAVATELSEEERAACPQVAAESESAGEQLAQPPGSPETREPEYLPEHAAAALAEAAGRLVIEAAGRSGESPAAALADLMSAAGGVSPAGFDDEVLPPPESCERFVVFQIGEQAYGLHITSVREVEKAGRVTPVPGAPPMIHGLINLHGEILPLIDPRPLLALPAREGASGGYLVVVRNSGEEGAVAWLVDGLGGMALVDRERVAAAGGQGRADSIGSAAVAGTARHRGRLLTLLDARRLASEEAIEQAAGGWKARPEVGL